MNTIKTDFNLIYQYVNELEQNNLIEIAFGVDEETIKDLLPYDELDVEEIRDVVFEDDKMSLREAYNIFINLLTNYINSREYETEQDVFYCDDYELDF